MFRLDQTSLSLCFIALIFSLQLSAQQVPRGSEAERPKLGLVLSGGGAKGMAHVGVIKAMEKAGLKADYVVGTSMGSVVGGLYALGYNSEELEQIIRSIDWELLLSNRVSFETISFEEKEYYNRYLLEFPITEGKISFRSGLIEGQTLSDVLHYYTWPANNYVSFDEFPIPFRCVATDISTAQPIVFDSGYLHSALRSSIAIPTVFSAYDLDSTAVVDGGVVNNFPVDVAREMGADIVIGVNVSEEDFVASKDLGSFAAILMQLAMSESLRRTKDNIAATDIYIKPDLGVYSTGSFNAYAEILRLGDEAGEAFYPQFKALADSLGMNEPAPGIGEKVPAVVVNDVQIVGNKLISTDLIRSKLDIAPNQVLSREQLEYAVNMVFGINAFYKVDYSLEPNGGVGFDLKIRVKEKPATLLYSTFHYDNQFSAGIVLNLTKRDWIGKSSRTVIVADISENPKFRFDYYKYTGEQKKFAFNARFNTLRQELPQYEEGKVTELIVERKNNAAIGLLSTSSLRQAFFFGAAYESSRSSGKLTINVPEEVRNVYQRYAGLRFRYYRNSQDDRNFPTRGAESIIQPIVNLRSWIGVNLRNGADSVVFGDSGLALPAEFFEEFIESLAPDAHLVLYTKYSKFFSFGKKFQIEPEVAAGITFGSTVEGSIYNEFLIGGFQNIQLTDTRFWGLNYAEITTPNFVKAGLEFQYIPINKIYLRGGVNWLGISDYVPIDDQDFSSLIFRDASYLGYGVDLSYQSILGPITVGVSRNTSDNEFRGYFSLGFSFGYTDR